MYKRQAGRTTLASSSGALVDWLNGDWGIFFILTALMVNFLAKIKKIEGSYEIRISEKHHKSKIDSPSGTAISLANAANIDEKKIESIREGDHGNWHRATIYSEFEGLQIEPSTTNRSIYAQGALNIVKWFYQKPKNLYYMQTLIEDLYE